jgi:anti-sigma factor RsiW
MDTRHPEADLLPYLRGELSADERRRVELHLAGCAFCRESIDSSAAILRAVADDIASLPEPDWKVYRAQLRRKLVARDQPRRRWWHSEITWPAVTAGVATAALAIAFTLLHFSKGPAMPPVDQFAMEDAMTGPEVGLLRNYQVVQHLDLLENYDVIERLDQLTPAVNPNAPSKS